MKMVEFVSESLCIDKDDLMSFSSTAPHRYKVYGIPKRSGKGTRTIAHPSKQLKYIQRLMLSELEKLVLVHDNAFAYRKNISIKDNARVHSSGKYLLKMDFKDFFPSITPELLFQEFKRIDVIWSDIDKELITNIFFFKIRKNSRLRLSIGAPSSPLISNFVMYSFDKAISKLCEEQGVKYSRYADDISFSSNTKGILFNFPKLVEETLKSEGYGNIKINKDKSVFSSKGHNRHITGVTLSNDGSLSVGREKKRLFSAAIHKYSIDKLEESEIDILRGHLSFAFFIEPQFKERMEKKYGKRNLKKLIHKSSS